MLIYLSLEKQTLGFFSLGKKAGAAAEQPIRAARAGSRAGQNLPGSSAVPGRPAGRRA
jgi:hypothetical protein